jgi:hypothetical protein
MRYKILGGLICAVLAVPGTAAAKYVAVDLALSGPGTGGPQVTESRRLIDRVSTTLLIDRVSVPLLTDTRARAGRPESTGPAYLLAYTFGVGDAHGSHTETIRQLLYPFAAGGPVVFTPRRQKIAMSFGPVRFAPGWVEVPPSIVHKLERVGLPDEPPAGAPVALASPQLESSGSSMPWLWGLTAGLSLVGALAWRRSSIT